MFLIFTGTVTAATVIVDSNGNGDYISIQEAVNNIVSGDSIIVNEGQYIEAVMIDKELSISANSGSPEPTIVQGDVLDENVFTVQANNVTISGFEILGMSSEGGNGISLDGVSGCSVKNNVVSNNFWGIYLHDSNNNSISDNVCRDNGKSGIFLVESNGNRFVHNNASHQSEGIVLDSSSVNVLEANIVNSNDESGILLREDCENNQLHYNSMIGNRYNFGDVHGGNIVDQSNLVDGKPIFYLEGLSDVVIDASSNAGTLYCYNCRNITIKDLVLKNNKYGVYLSGTEESHLYNLTCSENYDGIHLANSDENMVTDCSISNNALNGIYLTESEKNLIENNHIFANRNGVYFDNSEDNTLSSNIISNNSLGIEQGLSANNTIQENRVINNSYGIFLYRSDDNKIAGNEFSMNEHGIVLRYSNDNLLSENNINKSLTGIILLDSSSNNTLFNNYLSNNVGCIVGEKENNVFNNSCKNVVVGKVLPFIDPVYLIVIILVAFVIIRKMKREMK